MKITRNVNGQPLTFELDETELFAAYTEQQKAFDSEIIRECASANDVTLSQAEIMQAAAAYRGRLYDSCAISDESWAIADDIIEETINARKG